MKKQELTAFIQEANKKDEIINQLLKQKCEEYVKAQEVLNQELEELVQELFPEEIVELIDEWIGGTHCVFNLDDLWISNGRGIFSVRLDPNRYSNIRVNRVKVGSYMLDEYPSTIEELYKANSRMEEYKLLKSRLENKIEFIYDKLAEWKTEKINSQISLLNSLQFETEKTKSVKYKVTIMVEEIQ